MVGIISCQMPLDKKKFIISGSYLEIMSPDRRAASIVFEEFKRLDRIFNAYNQQSEVSKLNRTHNKEITISRDLIQLIKLSKELSILTNGTFDISHGRLYSFWKEIIKKGKIDKLPNKVEIEELKDKGGNRFIDINLKKSTVLIKKKGLRLDFGAIAKGFMVDKAIEKLKQNNINSALINFGGDIYCLGKNNNRPWVVGINDYKKQGKTIKEERVINKAIVTSGNYEQFFDFNQRRLSHIINPISGYPVENDVVSVTVIAASCAKADALATAFFVIGVKRTSKLLVKNNFKNKVEVFIITEDSGKREVYLF